MPALFASFVFAAAATFAVAVAFLTMAGRRSQIAALLADYRSLQRDREFLVTVTMVERPAPCFGPCFGPRSGAEQQVRRPARRVVNRAEPVRSAQCLRAAA